MKQPRKNTSRRSKKPLDRKGGSDIRDSAKYAGSDSYTDSRVRASSSSKVSEEDCHMVLPASGRGREHRYWYYTVIISSEYTTGTYRRRRRSRAREEEQWNEVADIIESLLNDGVRGSIQNWHEGHLHTFGVAITERTKTFPLAKVTERLTEACSGYDIVVENWKEISETEYCKMKLLFGASRMLTCGEEF